MADKRPDLEIMPYKRPNFIGDKIAPVLVVPVKDSKFQYDDIVSDAAAQTNRTVGTAPTATVISSANMAFDLTASPGEKIKRYKIGDSEINLRGGLDKAQAKMARKGKRSVATKQEDQVVAITFGDEANIESADIQASFLQALDVALEYVADKADGKIVLFGAFRVVQRLKRYDEVVERMKFTGVIPGDVRDVRSISDDQLAAALNIDAVLSGPSTEWLGTASAYDGWLGLMVLPDGETDPDEEVQFARTVLYEGGATNPNTGKPEPFVVETFYSDDLKSEVCDVSAWSLPKALNKECVYILKGIDEENAVTTTTTTTTAGA